MEDMTLNNSAANAEVNMNESTSVNENVSVGTDTPTVLPESPVIGFQAVDAEGNVLGFVSKAELVNEAKQALYADLAILEANRPTTLPANDMLADTSTLAATDVYEDQLAIKSDAPYIRGLDATGNPIRISKADLASVVGGLIGTVTVKKDGLLSKEEYARKLQGISLANNLIYKIAQMSNYTYVRFIGGSSGRLLSIIDFGVSKGISDISVIGQKPSFVSLKKGSDNSIYVMAPAGETVNGILLGNAVIAIERVSQFPSDSIDLT